MAYKIYIEMAAPDHQSGVFVDWEARVLDLHRRADISGVFMKGRELLNPAESPTILRLAKPIRAGQDAFTSAGGIHIVSRKMRDLFEEVDPGIHQFLPITVTDVRNAPFGEWFILNVHYRQDTAVDEPTDYPSGKKGSQGMRWLQDRTVTIDPARQSGVNLWREARFPSVCVISDRLHEEMKHRGMKFFKAIKLNNRAV